MTIVNLELKTIAKAHTQDTVVFFVFLYIFHRTTLEKTRLKKEYYYYYYYYYYDDECYKKVLFLSISVLQLFACWRSLGSYRGLEICCSLQLYVEVEPSDSQLSFKGYYYLRVQILADFENSGFSAY